MLYRKKLRSNVVLEYLAKGKTRGKSGFAVNMGTLNQDFTVYHI